MEIQRIIQDYYEQLYNDKFDNLEEMDKFLEAYNLPSLNQEEIAITSKEIKALIKKTPNKYNSRTRQFNK